MRRVVTQLKKRIDCVDFRKIHNGFTKCNFLLRHENILYGVNKEYIQNPMEKGKYYVVRDNIKYAVIDYPIGNLDYDQLVIDLIVIMFKISSHHNNISLIELQLQYLTSLKNENYYEKKYQQNLLLAKILCGNTRYIKLFNKFHLSRISSNSIVKIEKNIEEIMGMELYIRIKTTSIINPSRYEVMIKPLIQSLEDPSKLLDYLSYVAYYGAALILVKNMKVTTEYTFDNNINDKLIINFNSLYQDYTTRMKKIIMYKMIHAKRIKMIGRLVNAKCNKVLTYDNLYYLPEYISYLDNNTIKERKGNFIVKMNQQLEISDLYECISLEKIK